LSFRYFCEHMIAGSLIHDSLSPLRLSDTVGAALEYMHAMRVSELPVVDNNRLHNYARTLNLLQEKSDTRLSDIIPFNPHAPNAHAQQHVYEVIPLMVASDLEVMAVANDQNQIIGIIDQRKIQEIISQSLTYKGIGAVLVVMAEPRDFAPSHIMRLVEENGAKVLGMMVNQTEAGNLLVSLKLNTTLVKGIVASLSRFGYKTEDVYMSEDFNRQDNSEYESVLRFFDI
jgi:acetoin utilization protein AcuB